MLSISSGGRSTLSFAGLLRFLLLLPVNADLLPGSNSGTGSDVVYNKTTKIPILSIDEHSEDVEERKSSMAIFFILMVIAVSTLVVHILIVSKLYFIPESLAIVILGEFLLNIVIIHYFCLS